MRHSEAHGPAGYAANPIERDGRRLQLPLLEVSLPMHSNAVPRDIAEDKDEDEGFNVPSNIGQSQRHDDPSSKKRR